MATRGGRCMGAGRRSAAAAQQAAARQAAVCAPVGQQRLPAMRSHAQGFLQLAPKSAVSRLLGAAAQAEYSSPRPEPKGKAAPGGGAANVVASSASFRA